MPWKAWKGALLEKPSRQEVMIVAGRRPGRRFGYHFLCAALLRITEDGWKRQ